MFDFNENDKFVFFGDDASFVQEKVCARCGTGLSEILRTGIVGCAECYKNFETEIRNAIIQKQGTINHVGKISSKHFSKIKIREKIKELEMEKDAAAKDENYIVAEALKNQIEKLKGELWYERF